MGIARGSQALPLLLLLSSAAACGGVRTVENSTLPPHPTTTVEVRNLRPTDINLYVRTGTHRIRLGTAPGKTTRFFVIPAHVVGEKNLIRFELDTIGSDRRTLSEDVLPVNAGEQVLVTINHSTVADAAFPSSSFR
jgi:hypothetical protein